MLKRKNTDSFTFSMINQGFKIFLELANVSLAKEFRPKRGGETGPADLPARPTRALRFSDTTFYLVESLKLGTLNE